MQQLAQNILSGRVEPWCLLTPWPVFLSQPASVAGGHGGWQTWGAAGLSPGPSQLLSRLDPFRWGGVGMGGLS